MPEIMLRWFDSNGKRDGSQNNYLVFCKVYGVIGLMVKTTDCESVNESSILS